MLHTRKNESADSLYLALILASLEPKIMKLFKEAMASLREPKLFSEILELLEQGRIEEAMSLMQSSITRFANKMVPMYVLAGNSAAEKLSGLLGVVVDFNQVSDRAVRMMQRAQLNLIQELTNEQRKSIREVLVNGIQRGINPKQQALELRAALGLTQRQVQAINNYRRLLEMNSSESLSRALRDRRFDSTVLGSIRGNTALTSDQISRMVERYADKQLEFRAKTVARTEALRALHQANNEALLQAIEAGQLSPSDLKQEWITAQDERVRGSHATMHGQQRPFGEPFISGAGYRLMYPGDPNAPASEVINCRCVLTTQLTE